MQHSHPFASRAPWSPALPSPGLYHAEAKPPKSGERGQRRVSKRSRAREGAKRGGGLGSKPGRIYSSRIGGAKPLGRRPLPKLCSTLTRDIANTLPHCLSSLIWSWSSKRRGVVTCTMYCSLGAPFPATFLATSGRSKPVVWSLYIPLYVQTISRCHLQLPSQDFHRENPIGARGQEKAATFEAFVRPAPATTGRTSTSKTKYLRPSGNPGPVHEVARRQYHARKALCWSREPLHTINFGAFIRSDQRSTGQTGMCQGFRSSTATSPNQAFALPGYYQREKAAKSRRYTPCQNFLAISLPSSAISDHCHQTAHFRLYRSERSPQSIFAAVIVPVTGACVRQRTYLFNFLRCNEMFFEMTYEEWAMWACLMGTCLKGICLYVKWGMMFRV